MASEAVCTHGGFILKRREFLTTAGAAAALMQSKQMHAAQAGGPDSAQTMGTESNSRQAAARIPLVTNPGTMKGEMLHRELGATGEQVSVIGLGGSHLGKANVPEDEAIRLIHEGLDRGINFLDNSWDYNEGRSEERVGKALSQGGYRQKAFVMTKLDGRTKELATDQINDSLRRLKVDHIDLLQHHEVIRLLGSDSPEVQKLSPQLPG
jgi:uncharacterized protein